MNMLNIMLAETGAAELTKLTLVQDLAAVMLVAGIVAALFHLLGWPKVIGYIVAGSLMRMKFFNNLLISNEESINVLANLGIIFLMFTLGLELNIRKLRKLGRTVFPAAIYDLGMMILIGYVVGRQILGWDTIPSLFLGGVICDSSTTLLAKSLDEMGCSKEKFASVIFGTTISEDVLTIGIMAILTGLGMTGRFQAGELAKQLGLLGLFLTGVFIFGLLLLPPFLNKMLSRLQDEETLLIIIMGVTFGISLIAERMNFSLALGAFLVGAIISESKVRKRVNKNTVGVRCMFSAMFFVTIGLMVNPVQMWEHKWTILLLTAVVIVGKSLNSLASCLLTGQTFRDSLQIGVGLAQIGDFAYLVALMGIRLTNGAEPYPAMYQVAVGVSIITTLINPFILRKTGVFADWLFGHFPLSMQNGMKNYTAWSNRTGRELVSKNHLHQFGWHFMLFALNMVLIAVVFLVADYLKGVTSLWDRLPKWILEYKVVALWAVASILSIPMFLNGAWLGSRLGRDISGASSQNFAETQWVVSLRRIIRTTVRFITLGLLLLEYTFLSSLLVFNWYMFIGMLVIFMLAYIIWHDQFKTLATDAQDTLNSLMNGEDDGRDEVESVLLFSNHEFHLKVPKTSGCIDIPFNQLHLRNQTGATVSRIVRKDGTKLNNPGANASFQAEDDVYFLGDEAVEKKTKEFLAKTERPVYEESLSNLLQLHIEEIEVPEKSQVCFKTLRELRLRNLTGVTVARIVRNGVALKGLPGPEDRFEPHDKVSVMGTDEQIASVKKVIKLTLG